MQLAKSQPKGKAGKNCPEKSELFIQKNHRFTFKNGGFYGMPTAQGYTAPCVEGWVHYFMGSVLMRWDNEDEKDKVSIVLAIQNEPKARYYYTSSGCF